MTSVYILFALTDSYNNRRYRNQGGARGAYKWKRNVRKRVYKLHVDGYSTRQITAMTSIPKSTVHEIIKEQKVMKHD